MEPFVAKAVYLVAYWLANFAISGGGAVPKPGTIVYRFRLPNFVPTELLKASNNK